MRVDAKYVYVSDIATQDVLPLACITSHLLQSCRSAALLCLQSFERIADVAGRI